MKIFFTIFLYFLLITPGGNASCQTTTNDSTSSSITPMNATQLAKYRQSIWEDLPAAVGWVNFEELFTNEEENNLESLIEHFEKITGIEIMIVTIDTNLVAKSNFNEFSYRLLKIWGIGKRLKENGIIICISNGYHLLKITPDFGILKLMNESMTSRIKNKNFIPSYKKNRYYEGTYRGLNAIINHLSKRLKALGGEDLVF